MIAPVIELGLKADEHLEVPFWRFLSILAYPKDAKKRAAFMRRCERQSKQGRQVEPPGDFDGMLHAGWLSGSMLLTMIQLHEHYPPATLDRALALVQGKVRNYNFGSPAPLPQGEALTGELWHKVHQTDALKFNRQFVLNAQKSHQSVAHIWAAFDIAVLEGWDTFNPETESGRLLLCQLAMALLERASQIPPGRPGISKFIDPGAAWLATYRGKNVEPLGVDISKIPPEFWRLSRGGDE